MRPETVLDANGLPQIHAARDEDGQLNFYRLVRWNGGRVTLDEIPDEVLRGLDAAPGDRKLNQQIEQRAKALAASIHEGSQTRAARIEELEAKLADAEAFAEEQRLRIAMLEEAKLAEVAKPKAAKGKAPVRTPAA